MLKDANKLTLSIYSEIGLLIWSQMKVFKKLLKFFKFLRAYSKLIIYIIDVVRGIYRN